MQILSFKKRYLIAFPTIITCLAFGFIADLACATAISIFFYLTCGITLHTLHRRTQEAYPAVYHLIKTTLKQIKKHKNVQRTNHITLLIGPQKSGKSSVIKSAKTIPYTNIQTTNTYAWWLSPKGISLEIDTDGSFRPLENINPTLYWRAITDAIQHRFLRINQLHIVIMLPVTLFHTHNQAQYENSLQNLEYILKTLKKSQPRAQIDMICSHMDQVRGFQAYFCDLSNDERTRLLMIESPDNVQSLAGKEAYLPALKDHILSINQHILKRLKQEHDPSKKLEIHDFPMQLEQLQQPLHTLITRMALSCSQHFSALYFCANTCADTNFDFIHQQASSHSREQALSVFQNDSNHYGYFNTHLLAHIYKRSACYRISGQDWIITTLLSLVFLAATFSCFTLYQDYQNTQTTRLAVQKQLLDNPQNRQLSELDKLYMAWQTVSNQHSKNKQPTESSLKNTLKKYYQTQVVNQLPDTIQHIYTNYVQHALQTGTNFFQPFLLAESSQKGTYAASDLNQILPYIQSTMPHQYLHQHIATLIVLNTPIRLLSEPLYTEIKQLTSTLSIPDQAMLLVPKPSTPDLAVLGFPNQSLFSPSAITHTIEVAIPQACTILSENQHLSQYSKERCIEMTRTSFENELSNYYQFTIPLPNIDTKPHKLTTITHNLQALLRQQTEHSQRYQKAAQALQNINPDLAQQYTYWYTVMNNADLLELLKKLTKETEALSSTDAGAHAYHMIMQQEQQPEESIIRQLSNYTQHNLAAPVQAWIQPLLAYIQNKTEIQCYDYLNNLWQKTVFTVYQKRFANTFPMMTNSDDTLRFEHIKLFFGSSGIAENYYSLLQPIPAFSRKYVHQQNLAAFSELQNIQHNWLKRGELAPLDMHFVPMTLSKNAKQFTLEVGDKKIVMQDKDNHSAVIHWPASGDDLTAIEFVDTINHTNIKNKNNPWSLLQMINEDRKLYKKSQNQYTTTFQLAAFEAKYELILSRDFDITTFGGLTNFSLIETL